MGKTSGKKAAGYLQSKHRQLSKPKRSKGIRKAKHTAGFVPVDGVEMDVEPAATAVVNDGEQAVPGGRGSKKKPAKITRRLQRQRTASKKRNTAKKRHKKRIH